MAERTPRSEIGSLDDVANLVRAVRTQVRRRSSSLDLRQTIEQLRALDWDERWRIIAENRTELSHLLIPAANTIDPKIGLAIERVIAVGLDQAREEVSRAENLEILSRRESVDDGYIAAELCRASLDVVRGGQQWLAVYALKAFNESASRIEQSSIDEVRAAHLLLLGATNNVEPGWLRAAFDLLTAGDELLDSALTRRKEDLRALASGVEIILDHARTFGDPAASRNHAADVACVLSIAMTTDPDLSLQIREMVSNARRLVSSTGSTCQDYLFASHNMFRMYSSTSHQWLLEIALDLAQVSDGFDTRRAGPVQEDDATSPANDLELEIGILARSWHSAVLSTAVLIGLRPSEEMVRAVRLQRAAVEMTTHDHRLRATVLDDLGVRISDAVRVGCLEDTSLIEAERHCRDAVELARTTGQGIVAATHNLSAIIAESVQAGVQNADLLLEAIDLQREGLADPTIDGHDRAALLSSLGNRLTRVVINGTVTDSDANMYSEALEAHREALSLTSNTSTSWVTRATNLAACISEGCRRGLLPDGRRLESIDLLRQCLAATPNDSANRPTLLANLGTSIAEEISAGRLPSAMMAEALEHARQALELTPVSHPDRAAVGISFADRILQSIQAGVLPLPQIAEALDVARQAVFLTNSSHPSWPARASTLASLIAVSAAEGVVDPEMLLEAVELEGVCVERRPVGAAHARHASNLGCRISEAVQAGLLPVDRMEMSMTLQEVATTASDLPASERAAFKSNLGTRLHQMVMLGLRPMEDLLASLDAHRIALQLSRPADLDRVIYIAQCGVRLSDSVRAGLLSSVDAATEATALVDESWDVLRLLTWSPHQRLATLRTLREFSERVPQLLGAGLSAGEAIRAIESMRGHVYGAIRAPRPNPSGGDADSEWNTAADEYDKSQRLVAQNLIDPGTR